MTSWSPRQGSVISFVLSPTPSDETIFLRRHQEIREYCAQPEDKLSLEPTVKTLNVGPLLSVVSTAFRAQKSIFHIDNSNF